MNNPKLDKLLATNPNQRLIGELKTIDAGTTAESLTEAQKVAFMAMMRMVHDPSNCQYKKRLQKYASQKARKPKREATLKVQSSFAQGEITSESMIPKPPGPAKGSCTTAKPAFMKHGQRQRRLREKVRHMRSQARFPTPPTIPSDKYRRYGYIPASHRQQELASYAKC